MARQVDKTLEAKEQLLLITQERDRLRGVQSPVEAEGELRQGIEKDSLREVIVETPIFDSILRTPIGEEGSRPFPP